MIHSGSVIAAGISQGRSTSLKRDFKVSAPSPQGHSRARPTPPRSLLASASGPWGVRSLGAPCGGASAWKRRVALRSVHGNAAQRGREARVCRLVLPAQTAACGHCWSGQFSLDVSGQGGCPRPCSAVMPADPVAEPIHSPPPPLPPHLSHFGPCPRSPPLPHPPVTPSSPAPHCSPQPSPWE